MIIIRSILQDIELKISRCQKIFRLNNFVSILTLAAVKNNLHIEKSLLAPKQTLFITVTFVDTENVVPGKPQD